MQARMMGMFGQATSEGFGMSVSVGTTMLHGGKQKIGHEKNLTMIRMTGRATHRLVQTIGGAKGMKVTTKGSGRHVSARTVVVIRKLMKIGSNNGREKTMQMFVQDTQRLMTKISGRRPLEDIGGKSGGKRGTEKIGGNRRKRGMAKIGGQRGLGQTGGRRGVINGRGKDGVSDPGTQPVDRPVLLSTRHGIRHCFNGN